MCRLFGLIANRDVDINFSMLGANRSFKSLGEKNPDGWGIGWYQIDDEVRIKKEGKSAFEDPEFEKTTAYVNSKIVITHVRKGKEAIKANAHPFFVRNWEGQNWLFAHNGTVNQKIVEKICKQITPELRENIKSTRDSERYFCYLLTKIKECGSTESGIMEGIKGVRSNHHGLNFLMSDGTKLYAYREPYWDHHTLFYLKRPNSEDLSEMISEKTRMLIQTKMSKDENAVLVCSEELTKEKWTIIEDGELKIIDKNLKVKTVNI